ncbi:MAG: fibronectin type III domain-containing protein, partial [Thermoguttaceae bacterium]|nr:fibronectin type III domain-containing protein [Thermoguttaceae bacterium]
MSRFFQNFKSESQKRGSRAPMKPRRLATETLEDRRLLAVSPEILTALNGYESFGEYSADSVSTIEIAKNELTLDALNAAISQAASTPGDDAILIVGGGTLTFQPGDEAISIELDDATQGALTIVGYGGTFEIDANGVDRAFSIKSGTVKLGSIEISNGTADFGGAIANAGDLYLEDAILANNVATVSGGAIADKGWISVESTQILDNEATASGAAIYRGDFEFAQDENDSAPEATGTISDVSAAFGETVEIDLSQYFNEGDWTYSVKLPETLSDALAAEPTVVGNVLKLQFVAKADYSLDLDLSDVELVVAASNADGASADSNAFKVGLTDRYSSRVTAVLTSTSIDDAYDSYEVRRKGYGSDAVPSSDATSAQAPLAVQLWAEDFSDRHGLALDGDVGYTLVLRLTNATLDFDELDDLGADVYFDAFFGTIDGSDRFPNDLGPTDYIITIGYDPSEEHGTAFDATLLAHLPLIPTGDGPVSVSVEPSFDSRDPAVYRQFDGAALSVDLSQIEFVGATTAASSAAVLSNAGIAAAETTETRAAVLRDVLIAGASGGQGAIYVAASSSAALLVNATVVDNAVSGAAFVSAATGSKAVDSIFVGNGAAVSGVELQTVLTDDGAEGALAYDASKPLFADAAAGDYSLAKNAQVIDLATGSAASETDLAGNVRVSGAAADLGAYEYQGTAPAAPSDLAMSNYDGTKKTATLTWVDNADDETGYLVQSSSDGGKTWKSLTTLAANTTTRTCGGLNPGSTYMYRLAATNAYGQSEWATITFKAATAPAAPSDLAMTNYNPSTRTATLTWTDNADNETGYLVQSSSDGGKTWKSLTTLAANTTTRSCSGLNPGSTYIYRLAATNEYGQSEWATITFKASTVPAAPSDLTMTGYNPSTRTATLSWVDNADNETSYLVQSSTDGGKTWNALASLAADTTSRVCAGLYPGSTYMYRLAAENAHGQSEWATITFNAPTVPTAPSDLVLSNYDAVAGKVTMRWTDNADNETTYIVAYALVGSENWQTEEYAADATGCRFTSVDPSKSYVFRVYASNAAGDSDYIEATFNASTDVLTGLSFSSAAPKVGEELAITVAPTTANVSLQWFRVDASGQETAIDGATGATYVPTLADRGFTLKVVATGHNAAYASTVSATSGIVGAIPAAPSDLTMAGYDPVARTATLSWVDNADNETSYLVQSSTDGGKTWKSLTSLAANTTSRVCAGLYPGSTYMYRIAASNAYGQSEWATITFKASTIPAAPSDLTMAGYDPVARTATLSWVDNADNETSYLVQS